MNLLDIGHAHSADRRHPGAATRFALLALLSLLAFATRLVCLIAIGCHHLLHLLAGFSVLLHELVHFGYGNSCSIRNSFPPAAVDDFGFLTFLLGHRVDDALHAVERLFVDLSLRHHLVAAGKGRYEFPYTAHLSNLAVHVEEVVQIEVHATQSLSCLCFLFLLLDLDSAFDEADDIAHAEDSTCHAVWVEHFEGIGFLT